MKFTFDSKQYVIMDLAKLDCQSMKALIRYRREVRITTDMIVKPLRGADK